MKFKSGNRTAMIEIRNQAKMNIKSSRRFGRRERLGQKCKFREGVEELTDYNSGQNKIYERGSRRLERLE